MSVQGNCSYCSYSVADAASSLSLTAEEASALGRMLPLKPRQCVIILQDTFLMVNSGSLWLDNVYLIVLRARVQPSLVFIKTGEQIAPGEAFNHRMSSMKVFVTNVTMQGASRG